MTSLQLARKARLLDVSNRVSQLYRTIAKEIPKILTIYDIDMPVPEARQKVKEHFYSKKHIKDERIQDMLVEQGYYELETTMLMHKQLAQLSLLLEGPVSEEYYDNKRLGPKSTWEEQFARS